MTIAPHFLARAALVALAATVAACSGSPASPTTTTTTTTTSATATPVEPAYNEDFTGTIGVNGSSFYSFTVTQYGTVNLTLTSVSGAYIPSTVTMGLGLGVPSGEDCTETTTVTAHAGTTPQITGVFAAGVYCARIYDVGNLYGPAAFDVYIEYP